MPVYIHLANLFIKKSAVENKYKGGIVKFREDFFISGDNYNQEDNELFSIAKMNTDEFDLDYLFSKGLDYEVNLHTQLILPSNLAMVITNCDATGLMITIYLLGI